MGIIKVKAPKIVIPESDVIKAVKALLPIWDVQFGMTIWRNNTGVDQKRFFRYGEVGSPDFIGFNSNGRFMGIECKGTGKKLSADQKQWIERAVARNILVYVVIPIDYLWVTPLSEWIDEVKDA